MPDAHPSLVLGTAGHIDHGKSSLVLALTGTDPDRLLEEKKRGITIELGFARLELPGGTTMGVVDVPGHERFVRQMIAGSTGIDVALLCIAADDGVMPQTLEHLAVLELLGVPACVVALTKTDLVDEEWVAFVTDEIRTRLSTTPYANSTIVPVSSRTGAGIDQVKAAIEHVAQSTVRSNRGSAMRLPVDRVFSIHGAGTVVTGTLWSGRAAVGDEVEVLPSGLKTRIRSVQMHGESVEVAEAGHRVALNLNALSIDEVHPGDFIASLGCTTSTDRFDATLTYMGAPDWNKPLESGTRVHVAHGTREVTGRVLLINGQENLEAGQKAYAQIRLDEDLPVMWGDRFVLRSFSPVYVVGGGTVLRTHPRRSTTRNAAQMALLDALCSFDTAAVARAAFALADMPMSAAELARESGLSPDVALRELQALEGTGAAVRLTSNASADERWASKSVLQKRRSALENALLKFHAEQPERTGISKEDLRRRTCPHATVTCFDALLSDAASLGIVVVSAGEVSHPQAGAGAKKLEEQAAERLYSILVAANTTPPTISDLLAQSGTDEKVAYRALGTLERADKIAKVGTSFYFDMTALNKLEDALRSHLSDGQGASAADLKDAMQTSRKYAIPLLEYFDGIGITRREGDLRVLNQ